MAPCYAIRSGTGTAFRIAIETKADPRDSLAMRALILALAAGALSATGFAPLGLWPLTLAALALLMALTFNVSRIRTAFAMGYAFGLGHFGVGLNWIAASFSYQAAMPGWLGWIAVGIAALYLALFPGLATALAWRIGKAMPVTFVMLFAAAWIVTEFLRATILFSFAWNPLAAIAASDMESSGLMGVTAYIGTYGLSGILILAGGAIFLLFQTRFTAALMVAITLIVAAIPGIFVGQTVPSSDTPVQITAAPPDRPAIRVIQPNIDQSEKWGAEFAVRNFQRLVDATGKAGTVPRLIFWPEAAIPDFIEDEPLARFRIAKLLGPDDLLLLGATKSIIATDSTAVGAHNSLYAMDAMGTLLARYDKSNLVHFGEYLPLRGFFEAIGMSRLAPGDLDFRPGSGPQSFDLPGFGTVGGQICYEIIFSGHVADRTNRPDFLFNPSNDAWFGSWGPPQHLAQARLRAVEEALPVIRSTSTGISAIIGANGQIVDHIGDREAGVIDGHLPASRPPSLFARFGNNIPLLFALFLTIFAFALMHRAR